MRRNCCRKHLRRDLIILQQETLEETRKNLDAAILTFNLYLDQIGWRSSLRVLCDTAVLPFINPWGSQKINDDVKTEKAFLSVISCVTLWFWNMQYHFEKWKIVYAGEKYVFKLFSDFLEIFCNTRLVPDTRRPRDKSCLTSESFQKFLSVFNIYLEKVLSQTSKCLGEDWVKGCQPVSFQ